MSNNVDIIGSSNTDSIQVLIDSLPFYVLLVDEQHNIIKANTAVLNQLGFVPEDIIGKYCPRVIHGINTPFHGCPLEESVETGEALEREVFDDNSGRWLSSAIYPTNLMTTEGHKVYFHMVLDISEKKSAEEETSLSSERLRSLSAYLEMVVEEERQKIARDLHDDISQVIASINAHLSTAVIKLPEGAEESKMILQKTQDFSVQLLDRIHRLIYQLRPTILDDFGLIAAVEWLSHNSLEISGISVDIKISGQETDLSSELRTILFRVFQEIFSNILKHANAGKVYVRIYFWKNHLRINIKDDGVGFEVNEAINSKERPRGLGLIGMKERIDYLNGDINIASVPGKGTEIVIKVPYRYKTRRKRKGNNQYLWSKNSV